MPVPAVFEPTPVRCAGTCWQELVARIREKLAMEGAQDWRKSKSVDPRWANPSDPPIFQSDEHMEAYITAIYPGPHRCNPRLDDFLQGMFRFPPKPNGTFATFIRCNRAEIGQEPREPFKYLPDDYFEI